MKPWSTPTKLGAYGSALAIVFAASFGVGHLVDPIKPKPKAEAHGGMEPGGHDMDALPGGLAVSSDGYTLLPASTTLPASTKAPFRFTITGPDGHAVTSFEEMHEKELHLIVVRRDMSGFQHVHPVRDANGTWSIDLDLSQGGSYRAFADFTPQGHDSITLGTDLNVSGPFTPVPLPEASSNATVDDYAITLAGAPVAGEESELAFTMTRNGAPVDNLEPYLGAFGHLVSLRGGDLAYLHVHPADHAEPGQHGGPTVSFSAHFPTAGTYRLYLDFQVDGKVHTAEFTVNVGMHP